MDKQPDPKKSALEELAGFIGRKRQEFNNSRAKQQTGTFAGLEEMLKKRKEGSK